MTQPKIDDDVIFKLNAIAKGEDIYGRKVTFQDQQMALNALYKMQRDLIADGQVREKMDEEKRQALVKEDIEYRKLEVEKTKQVVEMFRIAASAGMEMGQLTEIFTVLTTNLLPETVNIKQLETKKE